MRRLAAGLFAFGLIGCASSSPKITDHLTPEQVHGVRNPVPFIAQERNYCGPTVLKMSADLIVPNLPMETYKALTFTDAASGTYKSEMISAARRLGLAPYRAPGLEEILRFSEAGEPVMVFQNLGLSWWPRWHYALVVGYDGGANEMILHSGGEAYDRMSFVRFVDAWEAGGKWAYVLRAPGHIPDIASFEETLNNGTVFEKLGRTEEAKAVYQGMTERWPERYEPHMGLAGVYYAEGRKRSALLHTRHAIAHHENPDLLLNLAILYFETGDTGKARLAKDRLLALVPDEAAAAAYRERLGF